MMKNLNAFLLLSLLLVGCSSSSPVEFVFFNLSGQEIRVTGIVGLPPNASPGVLVSVSDDTNRLNEASSILFENIRVGDRIKITWQEGGTLREVELQRSDLGLPVRLSGGRLRFTYLGDGKWQVKLL